MVTTILLRSVCIAAVACGTHLVANASHPQSLDLIANMQVRDVTKDSPPGKVAPDQVPTITLGDTPSTQSGLATMLRSVEQLDYMSWGVYLIKGLRLEMDAHMNAQDRALEKSILYNFQLSEEANATSHYGSDGKRYITITTGLLKYVDLMSTANTMNLEFRGRDGYFSQLCLNAYLNYLVQSAKVGILLEHAGTSSEPTIAPGQFTSAHPDICPLVSDSQLAYGHAADRWGAYYGQMVTHSMMFMVLHEFAHFRRGEVGRHFEMARQRKCEVDADLFAVRFLQRSHSDTLFTMPLAFMAGLEDFSVDDRNSGHPSSLKRLRNVAHATRRQTQSKAFQESLKDHGPDGAEQFKRWSDILDRVPK